MFERKKIACKYIFLVLSQPFRVIKYNIYIVALLRLIFRKGSNRETDLSIKFLFSDGWVNKHIYLSNSYKRWLFLLFLNKITFNSVNVWYLILIGHPGSLPAQFPCSDHGGRAIRRSDFSTSDVSTERIPWVIIIRLIKTGTKRCK